MMCSRSINHRLSGILKAPLTVRLFFLLLVSCSGDPALDIIPPLNLDNLEPQVIAKIDSLQMVVAEHPQSATAWGKLAMNLFVHGFEKESILCYEYAAKLDSADFRWPYFIAYARQRNNLAEYLEWYQRSQRLNQGYAPLSVRLGEALFREGRIEEAQRAFTQAKKADSTLSHADLGLARIALQREDLDACLRHLERALQNNPAHREVYGLLATVYRRTNKLKEATRQMEIANSIPGHTEIPDRVLYEVYSEGVSSAWRRRRGMVYMETGHFSAAVREFQAVLAVNPSSDGYYNLGSAFHKSGKLSEAIENYQKALSLKPDFPRALSDLGGTLLQIGRGDEAVPYLQRALEIQPGYLSAAFNLFNIYKYQRKFAEAIQILREVKQYRPDDINLTRQLAWLLATVPDADLRNGSEATALAEIICQKSNYRDPVSLDVLAAAYAETGQFSKAVKTAKNAYRLALELQKNNFANKIQARITLYERGQPYHEEMVRNKNG